MTHAFRESPTGRLTLRKAHMDATSTTKPLQDKHFRKIGTLYPYGTFQAMTATGGLELSHPRSFFQLHSEVEKIGRNVWV